MRFCLLALVLAGSPVQSGRATVHGLKMYYELRGEGRPVLLLHGGLSTIQGTFSHQLDALSAGHRVIAPEQMGHGRTPDADRPFRYADMAEDTFELLRQLGVDQTDAVGWSDGGIIGLLLAARHPSLVRRVAVSGVNLSAGGLDARYRAWLEKTSPQDWPAATREAYAKSSPDGEAHWVPLVERLTDMWRHFEVTRKEVTQVKCPVLLLAGDHDQIRLEHTLELYRTLPNAQLAVLPNTGHNTFNQRPDAVNALVLDFLDAP